MSIIFDDAIPPIDPATLLSYMEEATDDDLAFILRVLLARAHVPGRDPTPYRVAASAIYHEIIARQRRREEGL